MDFALYMDTESYNLNWDLDSRARIHQNSTVVQPFFIPENKLISSLDYC